MINDLADKNSRQALIERYLDADTTPAEEQRLREWFAGHEADADEREIALLVGLAAPCASCLPELDETEAEFDRIVAAAEASRRISRRRRRLRWSAGIGAAAAAIALFFFLRPVGNQEKPLSPVVIAEGIKQIMMISPDQIESVVATPSGSKAILTAYLKDGRTYSYILTYDTDDGTTSLLANNKLSRNRQ
ncbi:MAG: hypothetical protein IJL93_08380 [Bacteroidales bacterium]|nr:hypothetical protein [Bacteroidales bacterium]